MQEVGELGVFPKRRALMEGWKRLQLAASHKANSKSRGQSARRKECRRGMIEIHRADDRNGKNVGNNNQRRLVPGEASEDLSCNSKQGSSELLTSFRWLEFILYHMVNSQNGLL